MKKKLIKSGIQRKYLKYIMGVLLLAILLSSIGVWIFVGKSLTTEVTDKYEFVNEKLGFFMESLFLKSDEATAECITYDLVQQSLKKVPLEDVEKNSLQKYFAYINLDYVSEYCYVDNKNNVYARSYSKIDYDDFVKSKLQEQMGDSYGATQWFWTKDTLFGSEKDALFIGRYVHSMEYAAKPGILLLKMNDGFLESVLGKDRSLTSEVGIGVMDKDGNLCASWCPDGMKLTKKIQQEIYGLSKTGEEGIVAKSSQVTGGVCSVYRQEESGMSIFTIVPESVMHQGTVRVMMILVGIYFFVAVIAVILSIYFSKRLTSPIRQISEEMTRFDGNDFSRLIELNTNTELDQIGHSYNKMLKNIENLLAEIKDQEGELRRTELNMLLAQINPHFLYNTLDTIYMLARINGEETTMKMIQALSRYLRLSLSKGSDIVTVEDELENVKSYMEIQQIRNADLFRYEIACEVEARKTWMLKLVLQPLVENAIKYGFCEIYENGLIRIEISREADWLKIVVFNNGTPIDREMMEKINALNGQTILQAKECFQEKDHGYGVVNVLTRLRLKYGEDVLFYYEAEENGTRCTIKIPDDGKENRDL